MSALPGYDDDELRPGVRVGRGRFEIVSRLGKGGSASVYRARMRGADEDVALKILGSGFGEDSDAQHRFYNEALLAKALEDVPRVVRVLESGTLEEIEGRSYIALELVKGPSLASRLVGRVESIWTAVELAAQLARTVEQLHARGVVHRDIKPGNIVVTRDDEVPYLIDFGIAHSAGLGQLPLAAGLTREFHRPGTMQYMAPEQVVGESVRPSFDVYALASVLYEMLVGRPPFFGVPLEKLGARKCDAGKAEASIRGEVDELPEGLVALVDAGLRREASARVSSARKFAEGLEGLLAPGGLRPRAREADACQRRVSSPVREAVPRGGTKVVPLRGGTKVVPLRGGTKVVVEVAAVEAAVNRGGTEVVALRGGTEVVEVEAVEAAMGQLDAVEADRTEVDGDRTDVVRMEVDGVRVPLPPVSGLPELSPMVVAEAKGGAWWLRVAVVVAAGFAVWLIWPRGTAVKSGDGGGVEAVSEAQAHDGARVVGASTDVKPRAEVAPANVGPPQLQTPPSPASVGGTDAEVEQAPDVEPTPREPRPSSPTGTEPVDAIVQKPPEARPTSPAVDCDGVVANANAAADRRAWAKVYTATSRKKRRCWASRSAYRVLRVQSALRTEHFAECVSVAGDDPAVARERRRCMTKMDSK